MGSRARLFEWVLVGIATVAAVPIVIASAARLQSRGMQPVVHAAALERSSPSLPKVGERIGTLAIPSVGLTVPVMEGCTAATLDAGTCRMVETARLGGLGTVAVAGHRDAAFAALSRLHAGDVIRASAPDGSFDYIVDTMKVVRPEQVDVVAEGDRPALVLITCYPFHFIGAAPERFVVTAHLRL